MTYKEFINGINSGTIKEIKFFVKDYNHYRNCSIRAFNDAFKFMGRDVVLPTIECKLTNDNTEIVRFLHTFNEDLKLFTIKRIRYTLEQIWDKIEITEIIK